MADNSKIEWTDATWQPITGCSIVSPGCTNCYAMKLAGTRLRHHPSRAGLTRDTKAGPVWTGEVRFNKDWLDQPLRWKRPRRIFVCAHGDLFAEGVPDEWIDRVFAVMALAPQHTFQVLTKRAKRMRDYLSTGRAHPVGLAALEQTLRSMAEIPRSKVGEGIILQGDIVHLNVWPLPNVWAGVSVEDQPRADERIPELLSTLAAKRFISAEPLLGPIDLTRLCILPKMPGSVRAGIHIDALRGRYCESGVVYKGAWNIDGPAPPDSERRRLDWVIAGGESGKDARPMHPDWPRSLRDQCQVAGVAFFFKQWGEWAPECGDDENALLTFAHPKDASRYGETGMGARNVWRVGRAAAGRLLDGRVWSEFPA